MSGKWGKLLRPVWLFALLASAAQGGLCAPAQSITTIAGSPPPPVRIALLLPLRSASLGTAAEAVRAGVTAAWEREKDNVLLNLVETDGSITDVLNAYAAAAAKNDIVIGPLARTEVASLASRGPISKPTIALASRDALEGEPMPANMLAMGLSAEDEARQVAHWIGGSARPGATAFVISAGAPWQKRAAKAFVTQWQLLGRSAQSIDLAMVENYLSGAGVGALRKRIKAEVPALMFLALDAGQAAQLRAALGSETAMYGTSQLNSLVRVSKDSPMPADASQTEMRVGLGGVLLVDIPWQLQADHPAVMVYPQLLGQSDPPPTADQARLYALGIDAYRVAHELALRGARFELDGVTGHLKVQFEPGGAHFERSEQPAVYRDGVVVPVDGG